MKIRSTTVICVRKDGKVALGADGQVTLDKTVVKHGAKKLRRLEALLVVADKERTLILSGTGDVVEPDEGVAAIGSGGPYAQAAAVALLKHSPLSARQITEESLRIAGRICIYTNDQISIEEL